MRIWLALVISCAAATVLADPSPPPDAQAHLDRGTHLYELQDYDGAVAEFQAGYLLEPRAEFLYAIGQAYRMKGDCERALRSYTAAIRAPDGAALAEAAQQNLKRCTPAVTPPPPPVTQPPAVARPVAVRREPVAWYRDPVADTLVIGGLVLVAGGTISWKVGRDDAAHTYDARTYDAWLASFHGADHAATLQGIGTTAMAIGGGAVLAGVVRYLWPRRAVDAAVTTSSIAARLAIEF